jgi:hypothetical protein
VIGYELLPNDTNKILQIKKRTIEKLNTKNIELESKVKEGNTKIIELKNKNNYESHLSEIGSLKVKVQHIETENYVLWISNVLSCSTKIDLRKIYVGRKTHDKIRLEYIKPLPSLISKVTGSPKEKWELSKKLKK